MKKWMSWLMVGLLAVSLAGCGKAAKEPADGANKTKKTTAPLSVSTTASNADVTAVAENVTTSENVTTTTVQAWNGASYNGQWATRDFSWENGGGKHLAVEVNATAITAEYTEVFSSKHVTATLTFPVSGVVNGVVTGGFSDSYGNTGTVKLTFENNRIVSEISNVVESNMSTGYCLNEGEFILHPYKEEPKKVVTLYKVIGPFGDPVYCTDPKNLDTACSDPSSYGEYEVIDVTSEYNYYQEVTYIYIVIGPLGDPVYCTDPTDPSTCFASDPAALEQYAPYEVVDMTAQYDYSF